MKKLIYQYNPHWESKISVYKYFERKNILQKLINELQNKQITFITGLRRVGKTTLMKMLINYLIEDKGVESSKIMYVSLDNYLFTKNSIIEIMVRNFFNPVCAPNRLLEMMTTYLLSR